MKLSLFLLLCLTDVLLTPQAVRHDYYMITTPATWIDAQAYCRSKYTDLAIVQTDDDWQQLTNEAASKGLAITGWVGLYLNVQSWYWSSLTVNVLDASLTYWGLEQPDNSGGNEACVAIETSGDWNDYPCTDLKPFICYDATSGGFVAFLGSTMNWWGGQTYCRSYYTDLASVKTTEDQSQLQQIASSQDSSWFGLFRDPWLWSDGTIYVGLRWNYGFPNNVDHNDNCGLVNNGLFEDRQCDGVFNFFCHTPFTIRYQVVKLQIKGDQSVFDPAVQSAILQQIVQKLNEHGLSRKVTVAWRVQPDGNIFHKQGIIDL